MAEKELVKAVIEYLQRIKHWKVWRQNSGAFKDSTGHFYRFSTINGISDVIGWTPDGKFLAVECKFGKGKLRPEQLEFLTALKASGGVAMTVYSLDELIAQLKEYGY